MPEKAISSECFGVRPRKKNAYIQMFIPPFRHVAPVLKLSEEYLKKFKFRVRVANSLNNRVTVNTTKATVIVVHSL